MSQVNVNQPDTPPASDGSGYGFIVGIIVAILVIVLVLWLLVFNQGSTPPGNTDGGGTTPIPSGARIVTLV